ncbi:hypothetical protein D9615_002171 [Tricholomella constricta]|uniref:Uncharacterized protein n=1 Tax=Tricholomella constricta TaxID=117010 RepID=A0A8H5M9B9_9AGAR|nr:hypothetical protein D9615_002171 [Tricholomella constricta]
MGLNEELQSVLEHNPQPLVPDPDSPCPALTSPVSFYDKHLDQRLALKKVVMLPSVATELSKAIDRIFTTIRDDNLVLPGVNYGFPTLESMLDYLEEGPVKDAKSVGQAYMAVTGMFANNLASMLSLHLKAPRWTSAVRFLGRRVARDQEHYTLVEDFAPEFLEPYREPKYYGMVRKETWDSMAETTKRDLEKARQKFPVLAVWQFFFVSCEVEAAFRHMEKLAEMDMFRSQTFLTVAPEYLPANIGLPQSLDAVSTPWVASILPHLSKPSNPGCTRSSGQSTVSTGPGNLLRRSKRLSTRTAAEAKRAKKFTTGDGVDSTSPSTTNSKRKWSNVTIPGKTTMADATDGLATSILQHAWARAVERDSSFIVFHCGNFERIAFRHRSSQTLFISELIDVTQCKEPGYGEIHVALFMAIIEDVLDRTQQLVQSETEAKSPSKSRKRKREERLSSEGNKRPKTRAPIVLEAQAAELAVVAKAIADRPLALLKIHDRHFNSPVPASLLHIDRQAPTDDTVFEPKEYFLLTITSKLGAGATGDVHSATLEFHISKTALTLTCERMTYCLRLRLKCLRCLLLQYFIC